MAVKDMMFTEKFRPKSMETMILNKRITKIIGDGELSQNFLMQSRSPGTGKCVTQDTKIKIKNNETGEIKEISISDSFLL